METNWLLNRNRCRVWDNENHRWESADEVPLHLKLCEEPDSVGTCLLKSAVLRWAELDCKDVTHCWEPESVGLTRLNLQHPTEEAQSRWSSPQRALTSPPETFNTNYVYYSAHWQVVHHVHLIITYHQECMYVCTLVCVSVSKMYREQVDRIEWNLQEVITRWTSAGVSLIHSCHPNQLTLGNRNDYSSFSFTHTDTSGVVVAESPYQHTLWAFQCCNTLHCVICEYKII